MTLQVCKIPFLNSATYQDVWKPWKTVFVNTIRTKPRTWLLRRAICPEAPRLVVVAIIVNFRLGTCWSLTLLQLYGSRGRQCMPMQCQQAPPSKLRRPIDSFRRHKLHIEVQVYHLRATWSDQHHQFIIIITNNVIRCSYLAGLIVSTALDILESS